MERKIFIAICLHIGAFFVNLTELERGELIGKRLINEQNRLVMDRSISRFVEMLSHLCQLRLLFDSGLRIH